MNEFYDVYFKGCSNNDPQINLIWQEKRDYIHLELVVDHDTKDIVLISGGGEEIIDTLKQLRNIIENEVSRVDSNIDLELIWQDIILSLNK